jgi:hypothetical protein
MKTRIQLSTLLAAIALVALLVPTMGRQSEANAQGRHPHYLHALSDLRLARAYLDRLTPSEHIDDEQMHAIQEIDAAIQEIKKASIDDGKDIHAHEPIDAHIEPRGRFGKAREALNAALKDVSKEEDDPYTKGLQFRAQEHIRHASETVRHIQERLHFL